ncbi:hypothetical protein JCM10908_003164 [Rhodotorula pacifica]|uniref:uncharacterized protein n=1 Tax=Rhodotorula pacifica TaxID=1495444 RepID=UPI00317473E3
MVEPVKISYNALVANDPSLSAQIERAFDSSPDALGLLIVCDLPAEFPALRKRLLHLADKFASLPEETREQYARPPDYSFGWSHGKEVMNGKPDRLKGSFYNNPKEDVTPGLHEGDEPIHNVWPKEKEVEGFEDAFKQLCKLMVEIGELVASACDAFVGKTASSKSVNELIRESHSSKARLLHYFPREGEPFSLPPSESVPDEPYKPEDVDDSWCGTHIDHSLLTVLCPSMYLFHPTAAAPATSALDPLVIPAPARSTGLFIKTRGGQIVQATIPEDCVALQTGETLELLTARRLAATPHFVNSTASTLGRRALAAIERKKAEEPERWSGVEKGTVSRETLAVFLQPNHNEVVSESGETFGAFTERVFKRHYAQEER